MSTIKSSDEHLTINADGSGKEVKIQRDGTEVLATTSSGVDISGSVSDTDGNVRSGRKNLIINGGFDVWQRGTSFSGVASNAYHADRWTNWSNGGSLDITKVEGGLQFTSAGTGTTQALIQDIEVQDVPLGGYTLSFDADNYSNIATVQCYSIGGGTHVGAMTEVADGVYTFTLASTNKTASTTAIRIQIVPYTGNTTVINNVQLELGSVATDFEHRSYGEELALCQRYYQRVGTSGVDYNMNITHCYALASSSVYSNVKFSTSMRTSPTVAIFNTSTSKVNTPFVSSSSIHGFRVDAIGSSTGVGYYRYNYTADAEI